MALLLETLDRDSKKPVNICIECAEVVDSLFVKYSEGHIRLTRCVKFNITSAASFSALIVQSASFLYFFIQLGKLTAVIILQTWDSSPILLLVIATVLVGMGVLMLDAADQ
eukprot:gene14200-30217_t